ncbi:hypothetical protein ABIF38_008781 [Bradyrhizobium japonicum]|uniref:hypothetical protein n=1 Tax=Bradyrhizobium elkanii TaxID=29448 RepID=UPI000369A12F|nr:hypothetical protein [Bradyrhizobium elkanii]MCP1728903.1 hypothetical protein [Bradyrhizobium elkanii]MCS3573028.1 hypothetical protein [Bradyrhizobium elkanii]MCS3594279.1 hypothetical protein [Bradyrhizobium elkanii]MCS3623722.1 hypothetical protein [Bradyrhizobium elkanii]UQD79915.1 hypothetical protein JEY66_34440 [Bradyrhizobium elkanii USDA 76]
MKAPSFFRAVNLRADLDHPDRLSHYHPTTRSVAVVDAVLRNDASIVIAAYGSGKSLAAGIGALLVRNDAGAKDALQPVIRRMKPVAPKLYAKAKDRVASRSKGLIVNLAGFASDVVDAMATAVGAPKRIKELDRLLTWITEEVRTDHVAIIWDEFGRHLEGLAAEGRARDLDQVQRLAEWTSRAKKPTSSLTLLLHQNLSAYAGRLNQTSRNEWKKIEGRFRQLRFVEDSKELYSLVAAAAAQRRARNVASLPASTLASVSRAAVQHNWFDGPRLTNEIVELLRVAYPISAGALQVLPQVVARIGQNERSIFSFLQAMDLSKPVGVEEVYRFFSQFMRTDTGPGGSQRRWLETESARAKAESDIERELLAAACLFQLGASGERRRLTKAALITAVVSRGISISQVSSGLEKLLERRLLIYRERNDDVSLWHGIDVDIPARVAEECARREDQFDLVSFLNARHPAPILRAPRHNARFGTSRYLAGRYVMPSQVRQPMETNGGSAWGSVDFVLADAADGIEEAKSAAASSDPQYRRLIVIPRKPLAITEAALELAALEALREDEEFLSRDPLVRPELDELLALARRQLASTLHKLTSDRAGGADWHLGGRQIQITMDRPASVAASDLLDAWYPDTPRMINDQLMRQRVSRQMSTARVRILMRSMERTHEPRLGYAEQDASVEASVYRTVLERTGLHRPLDDRWGFASPSQLGDPGLQRAWSIVQRYFSTVGGPRPLSELVSELSSPPIGLPLGVIPILVMAGYRAFAKVVSLRSEGSYVQDILGFEASKMFIEPERHTIEVHDGQERTLSYLSELAYVLTHERPAETDERLRFAYDAFVRWRAALPEGARHSVRLSPMTQRFLREINQEEDPARLFLEIMPGMFGKDHGLDGVVESIERVRNEIDSILDGYLEEAVRIIGSTFRINAADDALSSLQAWLSCLDVGMLMKRDDLRMTDRAILRTAYDTTNGRYTPQSLARSVSSILLQRGFEQWQDSTAGQFALLVRECRARIEDTALASEIPDERLAPIVRNRIVELEGVLARIGHREPRQIAKFGARS